MAIAMIELTCSACGKLFRHRKELRNRKDADQYELWARQNIDLCPDCYRSAQERSAKDDVLSALASHGIVLPDLTGVSDKQVSYAASVRISIIHANIKKLDSYKIFEEKAAENAANPDFAIYCEGRGMTVAEGIAKARIAHGFDALHVALTATNASEILDHH